MHRVFSEVDVKQLVANDRHMMNALRLASELNLPDWWIGAGFLRNKVWDVMSGASSSAQSDIDLVYFNLQDTEPETDWAYDDQLRALDPQNQWEVRNQARMHYVNGFKPFVSTEDGIAHWTETATAIAVKLEGNELKLLYCYGSGDLLKMIARPTPPLIEEGLIKIFRDRMQKKAWQKRWPELRIKEK